MFKSSCLTAGKRSNLIRCSWSLTEDKRATSLAKSRSSSKEVRVQLIPLLLFSIVLRITQSTATKNTIVQPYVLVVEDGNGSRRLTKLWETARGASNPSQATLSSLMIRELSNHRTMEMVSMWELDLWLHSAPTDHSWNVRTMHAPNGKDYTGGKNDASLLWHFRH